MAAKVAVRCLMQVVDDALHQPGDVIEVPADQVESLVEAGAVEVVEPEPEPETGAEAQGEPASEPEPEPEPEPKPQPKKPAARRKTGARKKAGTKRSS